MRLIVLKWGSSLPLRSYLVNVRAGHILAGQHASAAEVFNDFWHTDMLPQSGLSCDQCPEPLLALGLMQVVALQRQLPLGHLLMHAGLRHISQPLRAAELVALSTGQGKCFRHDCVCLSPSAK